MSCIFFFHLFSWAILCWSCCCKCYVDLQSFDFHIDICLQDKDVRICGQCESQWYYNAEEQRCERFLYCGCSHSDNKFHTFQECEYTCSGRTGYVTPSPTRRPIWTYEPPTRRPVWTYEPPTQAPGPDRGLSVYSCVFCPGL